MDIRVHIKKLIDVDVDSDDFETLRACPEKFVRSEHELKKLKDLLLIMSPLEQGDESDDIY